MKQGNYPFPHCSGQRPRVQHIPGGNLQPWKSARDNRFPTAAGSVKARLNLKSDFAGNHFNGLAPMIASEIDSEVVEKMFCDGLYHN